MDPLARAACTNRPDLNWFADTTVEAKRAIAVCRTCPVSKPCCEEADRRKEQWGIWGGVNRSGRTAARREQRAVMQTIWIRTGVADTNIDRFDYKADMAARTEVCGGSLAAWKNGCRCDRCVTRFDPVVRRRLSAGDWWA